MMNIYNYLYNPDNNRFEKLLLLLHNPLPAHSCTLEGKDLASMVKDYVLALYWSHRFAFVSFLILNCGLQLIRLLMF
jgi:hypothetical protein